MYEQARDAWLSIGARSVAATAIVQIEVCALESSDYREARSLVREGLQMAHELDLKGPGCRVELSAGAGR